MWFNYSSVVFHCLYLRLAWSITASAWIMVSLGGSANWQLGTMVSLPQQAADVTWQGDQLPSQPPSPVYLPTSPANRLSTAVDSTFLPLPSILFYFVVNWCFCFSVFCSPVSLFFLVTFFWGRVKLLVLFFFHPSDFFFLSVAIFYIDFFLFRSGTLFLLPTFPIFFYPTFLSHKSLLVI